MRGVRVRVEGIALCSTSTGELIYKPASATSCLWIESSRAVQTYADKAAFALAFPIDSDTYPRFSTFVNADGIGRLRALIHTESHENLHKLK